MINLLPADLKETYRYARRNRQLFRWLTVAGAGLLVSGLLTIGGVLYMHTSATSYNDQIASTTKQLDDEHLTAVQKEVANISNNLKLVVQVLSKEILFSQLLKQLGTVTPPNVILTNLSISQAQGAIDITAQTGNYAAATQLQVNLADPANQIFAKADIVSITCANNATNSNYPCTATLRALFSADNPFLFINSGSKKAKS